MEEEEKFTLSDLMGKNKAADLSLSNSQKKKQNQKKQQIQQQHLQNSLNVEQNQQVQDSNYESLDRYLKRAFIKCKTKKERKEMKKQIQQDIKNVSQAQSVSEFDWDNKELPLLSREVIEKRLFNDPNAVNQQVNPTEQQIKIVDAIVKKIKEELLSNCPINQKIANEQNITNLSESITLNQSYDSLKNNIQIQNEQKISIKLTMNNLQNNMEVEADDSSIFYDEDDFDVERMKVPIIGTSTKLEKEYLRLTSYPKECDVRSPETLVKSFEFITNKYVNKSEDYHYFQSQFRSIRQDLLIQNIKNDFTFQVLEVNARICLENYDIQEYSRCLGQLIWMYKEVDDLAKTNYKEFIYYRLIQFIFEDKKDNLLTCLQEINQDELLLSNEFETAMKFQHAISMGNVKGLFNLFNSTKDYGKYIMSLYIKRWKIWGIRIVCKTYGPQAISLTLFQSIFGFESIEKTKEELKHLNCVLDQNEEKILVKDTIIQLDQQKI
ncbi:hypothetical protein ABPG72_011296 [Tetrahymena utriculariae]